MSFHFNHSEIGTLCADFRRFANNQPLYAHHAASYDDILHFIVNVPRKMGISALKVVFFDSENNDFLHVPMTWKSFDCGEDEYAVELNLKDLGLTCSLYFYLFEASTAYGHLVGGRSPDNSQISFHFGIGEHVKKFQLTVFDFVDAAPEWLYGSVIYHIFVDRFYRKGDIKLHEDAILNEDWENGIPQFPEYPGAPLKNNMFFGGNLAGIEEKLDYLSALGVGCLYLSPIFEAYSNHKYDTGDYMKIDDSFGGEPAFRSLLDAARKKGIRIILDGVFNHTGDDSIYFNRYGKYSSIGAFQSKESPYYQWYRFQNFPNEYTCWWNIPILPRIHAEEPSCRDYFVGENGVIAHYARMGIGGFRLDVADELSDSFIADIRRVLRENQKDAVLYGEVWEDASNKVAYGIQKTYYTGKELDGVMNYPLRTGIINFLRYRDPSVLHYALTEVIPNAPKRIADAQMNLLGTHDTERILTALAGRLRENRSNQELSTAKLNSDEYEKGVSLLTMAYTVLATLPGIPTIFYGDEAGMEGYQDPFNRLPFPWHRIDQTLLSHYQSLGELRKNHSVYRKGAFALLKLDEENLIFLRFDSNSCHLIVLNHGEQDCFLPIVNGVEMLLSLNCIKREEGFSILGGGVGVFSVLHQSVSALHGINGISLPAFIRRDLLFIKK